ncbi:hypothetical protein CEP53_004853 [Fusarium sp. AF-6]|nr:hypothetical protein CEP53_004853 [Fusarium sp. AF-6]
MPLKVLPANEADAPRAVAIEDIAYGPHPLGPVLFPYPSSGSSWGTSRVTDLIDRLHKNPACRWAKVIDTDLEGENMIAFAMWYIWETPPKASEFSSYRGPRCNPEACEAYLGGMDRMRLELMNDKPHAYLKLLHTDPAHQRRGAASMLVQWGLKEADRLGIAAVLESSDEGKGLYEKLGFKEARRFVVDLTPWGGPSDASIPIMLRPVGGRE